MNSSSYRTLQLVQVFHRSFVPFSLYKSQKKKKIMGVKSGGLGGHGMDPSTSDAPARTLCVQRSANIEAPRKTGPVHLKDGPRLSVSNPWEGKLSEHCQEGAVKRTQTQTNCRKGNDKSTQFLRSISK